MPYSGLRRLADPGDARGSLLLEERRVEHVDEHNVLRARERQAGSALACIQEQHTASGVRPKGIDGRREGGARDGARRRARLLPLGAPPRILPE